MKKKTKRIIWGAVIFVIALYFALPAIFNSKTEMNIQSEGISLYGSQENSFLSQYENYCEKNDCQRSSCIKPEDLPEDIRDFKICLCCVNFDYKEGSSTKEKEWEVKDYKLQIFYIENKQEKEKPYYFSDAQNRILLPTTTNKYISLVTDYSQPYYYEEDYPEYLRLNLHRIKIDYKKIFEFVTSQS